MRKIIHRINAPTIARTMMRNVRNAINHGIAHVDVRRRHIDLCAQNSLAVGKLAVLHAIKQLEILLNRSIAERTFNARLSQSAAHISDLLRARVVDIRQPALDQFDRVIEELLKIIRGVKLPIIPIETEPANIFLDRVDVFDIFLRRIGVVESKIANAVIELRKPEVQADRFRMPDMKIAVRLGRKARVNA